MASSSTPPSDIPPSNPPSFLCEVPVSLSEVSLTSRVLSVVQPARLGVSFPGGDCSIKSNEKAGLAWAPGTQQDSLGTVSGSRHDATDFLAIPGSQQDSAGEEGKWASSSLNALARHRRIHQALCMDHNRMQQASQQCPAHSGIQQVPCLDHLRHTDWVTHIGGFSSRFTISISPFSKSSCTHLGGLPGSLAIPEESSSQSGGDNSIPSLDAPV